MKVSMNSKTNPVNYEDSSNEWKGSKGADSGKPVDFFKGADPQGTGPEGTSRTDGWTKFLDGVRAMQPNASSGDWDYSIPDALQLFAEVDPVIANTADFCNAGKLYYADLQNNRLVQSIANIDEMLPKVSPALRKFLVEAREKRLHDKNVMIPKQIAIMDSRLESITSTYEKELELLKEYGKKYYEWKQKFPGTSKLAGKKEGTELYELLMAADLDNNGFYGDPEANKLFRATKQVEEDNEIFYIYDVINPDTGFPINFNDLGEIVGVGAKVDTNYQWKAFSNMKVRDSVPAGIDSDTDMVLEMTGQALEKTRVDNGTLLGAPITFMVPEYVMVDNETGRIVKFENLPNSNGMDWAIQKAGENTNYTLTRVTQVEILEENSLVHDLKDGIDEKDFVFILKDEKDNEIGKIRVTGGEYDGELISASDRVVSIYGGDKDDPYVRQTGLHIDGDNVEGRAGFDIMDKLLWEGLATDGYSIPGDGDIFGSDPKAKQFQTRLNSQLAQKTRFGLMCENLKTTSIYGSQGHDLFLTSGPESEYANEQFNYLNEQLPALGTTAIDGGGGHNMLISKNGGNLTLNQFTFVLGGTGKYDAYINTTRAFDSEEANCYIGIEATSGHIEIGNPYEKFDQDGFGINLDDAVMAANPDPVSGGKQYKYVGGEEGDDVYHIRPAGAVFQNYLEAEVWDYEVVDGSNHFKYRPGFSFQQKLDLYNQNEVANPGSSAEDIAVINEIKTMVMDQIDAHLTALEEIGVNTAEYEEMLAYEAGQWGGVFAENKAEVDAFFGGYDAFGGSIGGKEEFKSILEEYGVNLDEV